MMPGGENVQGGVEAEDVVGWRGGGQTWPEPQPRSLPCARRKEPVPLLPSGFSGTPQTASLNPPSQPELEQNNAHTLTPSVIVAGTLPY